MDYAFGRDSVSVGAQVPLMDSCRAHTVWTIDRYTADVAKRTQDLTGLENPGFEHWNKLLSYHSTEVVGNLITNAGWTRLMNLLTATGSTQALTGATTVRIGVGNSNTTETYTDTDLGATAGSSNRYFQPVTGAGTIGTRTLAFSAAFGGSDGNFAWNEFGIDVAAATVSGGTTVGALLFNHKAGIAQGTKASLQVWTATATITFT